MAPAIMTPHRRELLTIFVVAVLLRAVVYVVIASKAHVALGDLPYLSDGSAYIDNAKRINGDGMPNAYDQRVFVGFPWLIAMVHRAGVPYNAAAGGLGLLLPGIMCVAAAVYLRDVRIGWAMAVLPPHWILDTSAVMNESLMIGLCLVAMIALRKQAWWGVAIAAILFGAAGMARPMACFATGGTILFLLQAYRPGRAAALAITTGVAFGVLYFAFAEAYWNPLDNARAYGAQPLAYNGQVFTYPFGSFVEVARARGLLRPAFIYKSAYMLAAIVVLILATRSWWLTRRPLDAWAAAWWGGNLAFVACIGSHWGVDIAQRSLMWAAPAAFWTLREWLPRHWWTRAIWAAMALPWVFVTSQS